MQIVFYRQFCSGIPEYFQTVIFKTLEMQYYIFLNIAETVLYDIRGIIYVLAVVIADI
jgi:hypothetical protein